MIVERKIMMITTMVHLAPNHERDMMMMTSIPATEATALTREIGEIVETANVETIPTTNPATILAETIDGDEMKVMPPIMVHQGVTETETAVGIIMVVDDTMTAAIVTAITVGIGIGIGIEVATEVAIGTETETGTGIETGAEIEEVEIGRKVLM